jgi:hypothetical protein
VLKLKEILPGCTFHYYKDEGQSRKIH